MQIIFIGRSFNSNYFRNKQVYDENIVSICTLNRFHLIQGMMLLKMYQSHWDRKFFPYRFPCYSCSILHTFYCNNINYYCSEIELLANVIIYLYKLIFVQNIDNDLTLIKSTIISINNDVRKGTVVRSTSRDSVSALTVHQGGTSVCSGRMMRETRETCVTLSKEKKSRSKLQYSF